MSRASRHGSLYGARTSVFGQMRQRLGMSNLNQRVSMSNNELSRFNSRCVTRLRRNTNATGDAVPVAHLSSVGPG